MSKWKPLVTCLSILALAGLLAGCSQQNSTKVLSIGELQQFTGPDPFNVRTYLDYDILMLTYPELVQYNDHEQIVPDFASSWSHSADGLTWTFKVHAHAKWSDGKPLTASDVAWTINTIRKYQTGGAATFAAAVTNLVGASAPNPTTVVVRFSKPSAEVLAEFDIMPILPEHVWAKYASGTSGLSLQKASIKLPSVSGGPYVLSKWNGSSFLSLNANPFFYGPKPLTNSVGIEYFTSEDSLLLALKDHQIDYGNGLLPADAAVLRRDGLVVNTYSSTDILTLSVNDMPSGPAATLRNLSVRRAIDLAINRSQIVSIAYPGGLPAESVLEPANGVFYDSSVAPRYSPAAANELLDAAGFRRSASGVRVADGQPMNYTMIVGTDSGGAGARAAQIVQQDLQAIGINVSIKFLDPTTWANTIIGTKGKYNQFELALDGTVGLIDPEANLGGLSCKNLGTFNLSGFCSQKFESLYNAQAIAVDPAARKAVLDQAQEFAYNAVASIQLVYVPTVDAHQSGWTGFGASPFGSLNIFGKGPFDSIHYVG
jgi:peptide/nickel transport system substrate-binding protein